MLGKYKADYEVATDTIKESMSDYNHLLLRHMLVPFTFVNQDLKAKLARFKNLSEFSCAWIT